MNIVVNGNSIDVPLACNIVQLLDVLELDTRHVAVELNREILDRNRYSDFDIREGDTIEVVHFVGGG